MTYIISVMTFYNQPVAAGNILLGGFIGGGVDAATGATFDYPDNIEITMKNDKSAKA